MFGKRDEIRNPILIMYVNILYWQKTVREKLMTKIDLKEGYYQPGYHQTSESK